jgi:hypothetical protein
MHSAGRTKVYCRAICASRACFRAVFCSHFAAVNLQQAAVLNISENASLSRIFAWVVTGYAVLGTFMNAISRSRPERLLWTPIAALLAGLNITILVLAA